jgi:hypothetical protein
MKLDKFNEDNDLQYTNILFIVETCEVLKVDKMIEDKLEQL